MSQDVSRESFQTGQFIFLEGDKDQHFYIVEEGRVEIFTSPGGKYVKITEIGPGESFGEFALLDRAPRSASARALTTVELVKVSEKGFEELLSQIPDWAAGMLKSFANRLKSMNERLKSSPQFIAKKIESKNQLLTQTGLVAGSTISENNANPAYISEEVPLHKLIVRLSIVAFGFATLVLIASVYTH